MRPAFAQHGRKSRHYACGTLRGRPGEDTSGRPRGGDLRPSFARARGRVAPAVRGEPDPGRVGARGIVAFLSAPCAVLAPSARRAVLARTGPGCAPAAWLTLRSAVDGAFESVLPAMRAPRAKAADRPNRRARVATFEDESGTGINFCADLWLFPAIRLVTRTHFGVSLPAWDERGDVRSSVGFTTFERTI